MRFTIKDNDTFNNFCTNIEIISVVTMYSLTDLKTRRHFLWWALCHCQLFCGIPRIIRWSYAIKGHSVAHINTAYCFCAVTAAMMAVTVNQIPQKKCLPGHEQPRIH
ncbi:hypothetical protein SS33_03960 [Enterobacter kobei]|nr:hypothetical protein C2U44_33030 [Klebsiella oxytoca]KJM96133.1 hypothetical protein SS33_03960 [Enterobacter kobei]